MGWARVQSKSTVLATPALTVSTTLATTPRTGNKIIAGAVDSSGTAFSNVHDGAATNLTQLATAGTGVTVTLNAYDVPTTPQTVFTAVTTGSNTDMAIIVIEVAGLLHGNTAAMADGLAATSTANTNSYTNPSYTSSQKNEFLLNFYGDSGGPLTWATQAGWTADPNNNNSSTLNDIAFHYKDSTKAAENAAITLSGTATPWASVLVAFKTPYIPDITARRRRPERIRLRGHWFDTPFAIAVVNTPVYFPENARQKSRTPIVIRRGHRYDPPFPSTAPFSEARSLDWIKTRRRIPARTLPSRRWNAPFVVQNPPFQQHRTIKPVPRLRGHFYEPPWIIPVVNTPIYFPEWRHPRPFTTRSRSRTHRFDPPFTVVTPPPSIPSNFLVFMG